jgi:hypothetical protein
VCGGSVECGGGAAAVSPGFCGGAAARLERRWWRRSLLGRTNGRKGCGGGMASSNTGSGGLQGPAAGAGSAGGEARFGAMKNWSTGGLLERVRPFKEWVRNLLPAREATGCLASLRTVLIKESSDDPADLEMIGAGRGSPEDCAFRNALLRRGRRGAEVVEGLTGGESVEEESAGAASLAGRDGETERCKGGQVPQIAELPGPISRPCMS